MDILYERIEAEPIANGAAINIPRRVGKQIRLELQQAHGPKLVVDVLKALEPAYPMDADPSRPMGVVLTSRGPAWQVGHSRQWPGEISLKLRPIETPGFQFVLDPARARAIGEALVKFAEASEPKPVATSQQ